MASTKSRKNKVKQQHELPPEIEEWLETLPPEKEAKERAIAKQNLNRIIDACPALVAEALAAR